MNFYQIHIPVDGKFPTNRRKYINSVLKQINSEKDTYNLVSTKNFLKKSKYNVNFIEIDSILKDLFRFYPYFQICWNNLHVANKSDLIRMFILSRSIDSLYLDTDLELTQYPIIKKNDYLPSFAHSNYFKLCIDFFLIYNNNNFDWFREYLKRISMILEHKKIHEKEEVLDIRKMWKQLKIYSRDFKYNKFDESTFFIHHNLMGK